VHFIPKAETREKKNEAWNVRNANAREKCWTQTLTNSKFL